MTVSSRPEPNGQLQHANDERWLAFELLVREHYPALCAYALRYVHVRDTAEEVVQDVLLRVWCRPSRLADSDLLPFVYRSVAHAAISRLRAERTIQTRDLRLQLDAKTRTDTDDRATVEELELGVRKAIEALPERCRLVFLLSRDAGLTYAAIADRLGIAPKTVENQIVKALRLLRTALGPYLASVAALGVGRILGIGS
jgi:RNA polymerase sigma-70 factor, ECF subfamily